MIKDQTKAEKTAIVNYFSDVPFKSFVSIPIIYADVKMGVINVQSHSSNVFGETVKDQAEMFKYIQPFTVVLAHALSALNRFPQPP